MISRIHYLKSYLYPMNCIGVSQSTFLTNCNGRHGLLSSKAVESKLNADDQHSTTRKSPLNIQMLSESLYGQIFKQTSSQLPQVCEDDMKKIQKHLERFDLWHKQTTDVPDVDFKLPHIEGKLYSKRCTRQLLLSI